MIWLHLQDLEMENMQERIEKFINYVLELEPMDT
jgi:hypothetical protein